MGTEKTDRQEFASPLTRGTVLVDFNGNGAYLAAAMLSL
jgi:hypothetical protein